MSKRKIDARRVKIHRNYTISEVARLLGVHKHTVQTWFAAGLPYVNDRHPYLILGSELKGFLDQRRHAAKSPCVAGQLFCLKRRAPRRPAAGMLDYIPITLVSGNLRGICDTCHTLMYRRAALVNVSVIAAGCDVAFPQGQQRIIDRD